MSSIFEPTPAAAGWPRYQHIVLDCDSTLCAIEGIDCLAAQPDSRQQVVQLTNAAMNGQLPLDEVYGKRLELIAPTHSAVKELAATYIRSLVPGAREAVAGLLEQECDVYIVSGGLLEPVTELGVYLGIPAANIRAVEIEYDQLDGEWWQSDLAASTSHNQQCYFAYRHSELAESNGKASIITELLSGKTGASLLVGDGVSDLLARNAVDLFVGFGGVESRPKVRENAPVFIQSHSLLPLLALGLGSKAFYKLDHNLQRAALKQLKTEPPIFNRKILQRHFTDSFFN